MRRLSAPRHPPVVVKDLKAVDIQHANDGVLAMKQRVVVFDLDDTVDAADDPAEQSFIQSLQERRAVQRAASM